MFDFSSLPQRFWEVKLKSGETLFLSVPSKKQCDEMKHCLDALAKGIPADDELQTGEVWDLFCALLSQNQEKKPVDPNGLREQYQIEEAAAFLFAYFRFIMGEAEDPN